MDFFFGICEQSEVIYFIFLVESVYANCINYQIELNNLLHLISTDEPIEIQLHLRIIKYVMYNIESNNWLVRLTTKVCMSFSVTPSIKLCQYNYGLNTFQINSNDGKI